MAFGVWLGTSGVVALMSRTRPCVFCCISRSFAFGGKSVTHPMDHGMVSRLMFGLIKATRPQDEGEDEADVCALCCQQRPAITACGECQEHYCDEWIDAHTCG